MSAESPARGLSPPPPPRAAVRRSVAFRPDIDGSSQSSPNAPVSPFADPRVPDEAFAPPHDAQVTEQDPVQRGPPLAIQIPDQPHSRPTNQPPLIPESKIDVPDPEKGPIAPAAPGGREPSGVFQRLRLWFFETYAPRVDPPLILPSPPTDQEKYLYLRTNRFPLYAVGIFGFLALSAGMWLFVVSAPYFAWFGVFTGALQVYLIISYSVGVIGRDFDFEGHKKILQNHQPLPENAPTVDIYLPTCREPLEVLENTYRHISALDYFPGKLRIHVLDDGGLESVRALAQLYSFNYITRDDKPRLRKAGNLRWAFAQTNGDFFVIFDADFCPRPDFLRELLPYHLGDPKTAIMQSPQFFRVRDEQTWVEQGAGAIQELFYRVVQTNRNKWGASICVGSNAIYRREAFVEVGGTAEIGFSEDVHTGFGAVDRGWRVRYAPINLACGVCPDTPRAFFSQQMRWSMGSTTLLTTRKFWTSNLTASQKLCYLCGMMYYSAVSLSLFINPIPGLLLIWTRPQYFKYWNLAFAVPSVIFSLILFRLWAKAKYSLNVQFVMVIQSYAYLTAIKDRLTGRGLTWVPTGNHPGGHKHQKYRNMRILAWVWLISWESALIAGMGYQVSRGLEWYHIVPLLCLNLFNFFLAHRFLFCKS